MDRNVWESAAFLMEQGKEVDRDTGCLVSSPECAVSFLPYFAARGTKLVPVSEDVRFKVYFYRPAIPPELIHTYSYHAETNWTTFCPEFSDSDWAMGERVLPEDGFIRVALPAGRQGMLWTESIRMEEPQREEQPVPGWMERQVRSLKKRTEQCRQEGDLLLLLLADTHYAVGCIWPETLRSLQLAAQELHPDAVVHLGDFTDGLLPRKYTEMLANMLLSDLEGVCGKLYCCTGNHDRNYFRGNPDAMTREECTALYLREKEPWYFADYPEKKLRLLFLDSFDPVEKERYGFTAAEVRWVRRTLRRTPKGYRVILFSHVPPVAEIHVWSDTIRNQERMLRSVERFHLRRGGAVLTWIHGHSHADQVYRGRKFPVIGIGCSKLEDFTDHKPEKAVTYPREQHTETQELWDAVLVHPGTGGLDFLRFGAGEDRHLGKEGSDG